MECRYYSRSEFNRVKCKLCPHNCSISLGERGLCSVRKNIMGVLSSSVYGIASGISLDPVEKKPLYHFFPGQKIFSIGSFGCNLKCSFCQNYNISQLDSYAEIKGSGLASVKSIIDSTLSYPDCCGIAFTYNEPVVWYEYMFDIATMAKEYGLNTAMVTNGYINREPLNEILPFIDAFNVDLKAFNNDFYKNHTGGSLKPVLNSLSRIRSASSHLEISMLIIEGLNDNPDEFSSAVRWIAGNLGNDTPLHLSRYFPRYKLNIPPTSVSVLERLYKIALEHLDFVYLGNIPNPGFSDTLCPDCKSTVTSRSAYSTHQVNTGEDGECLSCGKMIYKNFTFLQEG